MKRLAPDDRDLQIAATISLPCCPFCGAQPIVFHEKNETTKLIVSRVACTDCHGSQHYCGRTREEARDGAISAWSKRI
jgi:hypothetical protein